MKNAQYDAFMTWMKTMTDEGFKQIVNFQYKNLNRQEIAKACGFSKSALRQNPDIAEELKKLEDNLRDSGILPPLTKKAKKDKNKPILYDQDANKRTQDTLRSSKLEKRVLELEKENSFLKANLERLKRLGELDEIITELELFPL
jgi:hypothetical protein